MTDKRSTAASRQIRVLAILAMTSTAVIALAGCGGGSDSSSSSSSPASDTKFLTLTDADHLAGPPIGPQTWFDLARDVCKDLQSGRNDFDVIQELDGVKGGDGNQQWNLQQEMAMIRDSVAVYCPDQWDGLGQGTRQGSATPPAVPS